MKRSMPCPTCGHYRWYPALDDWRVDNFVALYERAMAMPRGPDRTERLRGIVSDYGISRRTAQRYVRMARAA
jgi:hypothetical protein